MAQGARVRLSQLTDRKWGVEAGAPGSELLRLPLNPTPRHPVPEPPASGGRENGSLGRQFNKFLGTQGNKRSHCFLLTLRFGGDLVHRHVVSGDNTGLSFRRPGARVGYFSLNNFIVSLQVLGRSLRVCTCAHR